MGYYVFRIVHPERNWLTRLLHKTNSFELDRSVSGTSNTLGV